MILEKIEQFEPWNSLMYKQHKTDTERLLLQAVVMLSTQLPYRKSTPDEVYKEVCMQVQGLYK